MLTLPPAQARVASVALRNPANRHEAQMLTEKQFHYGFTNTLGEAESKPITTATRYLTAGVAGWEEIADYALDWATHHLACAKRAGAETA